MALVVVGVTPPTEIERRVRELQRMLYVRQAPAEGLALPVLIPVEAWVIPETQVDLPRLRAGRLEAPRLTAGAPAVQGDWLVWSVQAPQGFRELMAAWSVAPAGRLDPGGERFLPPGSGFLLAFSRSRAALEAAAGLLSAGTETEASRTFQPRCLGLYTIRPLPGDTTDTSSPAGASTWERLFTRGLLWEEIDSKPLRRAAG